LRAREEQHLVSLVAALDRAGREFRERRVVQLAEEGRASQRRNLVGSHRPTSSRRPPSPSIRNRNPPLRNRAWCDLSHFGAPRRRVMIRVEVDELRGDFDIQLRLILRGLISMSQYKRLWVTLCVVVAASFSLLGFFGYRAISNAPPIP